MHILRNARLSDDRVVNISIEDGLIEAVVDADERAQPPAPQNSALENAETDLRGWLTLPAMAEPHAHLDKALTAEQIPNLTGDLIGAIDAWILAARSGVLTYEDTVERAAAAMELLLVHGVTAVRTHINVLGCSHDIFP